ncbi:MAG: NAD-dependent epimerase/dehydratase family protein, partial [Gammaproteobacteria bacterium]|nr:NAD-dependent epimerase/dehydratase family protein [Gammaproteobacteria bacterium]
MQSLGAEAVAASLDELGNLTDAMRGCAAVIHAAAKVDDWGDRDEFFRVNVRGTENALSAARTAGVGRFVHVSTEAVLADGRPIVRADETRPRARHPVGLYPLTKGLAEERALAANSAEMESIVVRPRFVWGAGDTTVLPKLSAAVRTLP